jgi:hypothetical protein
MSIHLKMAMRYYAHSDCSSYLREIKNTSPSTLQCRQKQCYKASLINDFISTAQTCLQNSATREVALYCIRTPDDISLATYQLMPFDTIRLLIAAAPKQQQFYYKALD